MKKRYLEFLYRLGVFNIKLGLENMRNILSGLGNPHLHPGIIHFAGTNGKGSTLVTLENLLLKSGCSTGTTVSPHLVSFNERFRINGKNISDSLLNEAFLKVCESCGIEIDKLESYSGDSRVNPTFFEFAMAMAFYAFKAEKVDYVLLETGLGGRLDASNVIENPLACIITRIDYDHQEFLGETIELITNEKLGILKPNALVFVAKQIPGVTKQIEKVCQEKGNRCLTSDFNFLFQLNSKFDVKFSFQAIPEISDQNKTIDHTLEAEEISLPGIHQYENISTALAVYFSLMGEKSKLSDDQIRVCLKNIYWPGRLQYLNPEKTVLVDGAHNLSGMRSLLNFLTHKHKNDRILFATTWMEGKEIIPALAEFDLSRVTFLPVKIEMVSNFQTNKIAKELSQKGFKTLPIINTKHLIENYLNSKPDAYDLVLVAGSLYLLGEVMTMVENRS